MIPHDRGRFGSARWPERHELDRAGLHDGRGVFLGLSPHGDDALRLKSDAPLTTIGGSGSGKGRDVLLEAALTWPGPLLVNDPKAEIAAVTIHHAIKQGKAAYCINPCALHAGPPWFLPCHGLNPLSILTPESPSLTSDCKLIMEMLIKVSGGSGNSEFFDQRARDWCEALLKWMVSACGAVTLPEFYTLLNEIESSPGRWEEITAHELAHAPFEDVRRTAGEMHYKRRHAGSEFSGVMASIYKNLSFLNDPLLSSCLGKADFSLDALCRTDPPCTVFLNVPAEYMGIWSSFLRLIIGVAIICKQRSPGGRALFLIDEAGQLGHFEMLLRSYTYGRGAGLRTWGCFQDLGQVTRHYGPEGIQTFIASSQVRQFFGVRDYQTAKLVSDMLGHETLHYDDVLHQAMAQQRKMHAIRALMSGGDPFFAGFDAGHFAQAAEHRTQMPRALLTPDEILRLPEDRQVLFISGIDCPPLLARKLPYYARPKLTGAYLPNPYHPPYDRVAVAGGFRGRTLKVISEKVPARLSHWPQYQRGWRSFVR